MSPLTTHGVAWWPSGYGAGRHCDQQVAGSNPSRRAVEYNPGQVVNTHVPLSPSTGKQYNLVPTNVPMPVLQLGR